MFTGIIEGTGQIEAVTNQDGFRRIQVRGGPLLDGVRPGDSVAVNGVCLTARTAAASLFSADLAHETLERTSLKTLAAGTTVNLERPMRADGRFGGHIVQGHVDGVGRIRLFERIGDNWRLAIELPAGAGRYVVEKGSIAIDGISLTVAAVHGNIFEVAIIPHTFENTNLRHARPGDGVNLEFDIIAKYVEKMLLKS
jgi:riboflavin synthase